MKINEFDQGKNPLRKINEKYASKTKKVVEADPNTYRSDTKPSTGRNVGYEYDSDGNMVYHGGPEKSYRKYNMDPDWAARNPVKARQIAQAFGKSNPQADVNANTVRRNRGEPAPETPEFDPDNPQGDINRAKFGAMTTGDNKSELQKLRDLGYKWSDGSEINPSTERNYGPGSAADTQFVSRVAAGLPTDNTGMTGADIKQPFTRADQERHADLRFAQRQSTDTGYEYDPQKRFDQTYDRYPVIGNVPKSSNLGKTLNRIKGMFDDIEYSKNPVNEDFGSIPPLTDLIIMAVVGQTTVAALKAAFKAGKYALKLKRLADKAGVKLDRAVMGESNPFTDARMNAIKAGKKEFTVNGKKYRVTGDTSDEEEAIANEGILDDIKTRHRIKSRIKDFELDREDNDKFGLQNPRQDRAERRLRKKLGKQIPPRLSPDQTRNAEYQEAVNRDEYAATLAAKQQDKFFAAALAALDRLVKNDPRGQTVGGYAFDIARAFNGVNGRELEAAYNKNK